MVETEGLEPSIPRSRSGCLCRWATSRFRVPREVPDGRSKQPVPRPGIEPGRPRLGIEAIAPPSGGRGPLAAPCGLLPLESSVGPIRRFCGQALNGGLYGTPHLLSRVSGGQQGPGARLRTCSRGGFPVPLLASFEDAKHPSSLHRESNPDLLRTMQPC